MKNMTKNIIVISTICGLLGILTSCKSNDCILAPGGDGGFKIISTGSSEKIATEMALRDAGVVCDKQRASMVVVSLISMPQGLNEQQKDLTEFAKLILPGKNTLGSYSPEGHKYKAILNFKCSNK